MNGLELLAWIKSRPELRTIPFLSLTSTPSLIHQHQARRLGVDDYLVKPGAFHELVKLIQAVARRHGFNAQGDQVLSAGAG
jgi:DNA-binding response OmpR family regulator